MTVGSPLLMEVSYGQAMLLNVIAIGETTRIGIQWVS